MNSVRIPFKTFSVLFVALALLECSFLNAAHGNDRKAPQCRWAEFSKLILQNQLDSEQSSVICTDETAIRNSLSTDPESCFQNARTIDKQKAVYTSLRRQQLKRLLNQEVFYASRYSQSLAEKEDRWSTLQKKWIRRLSEDPEVLEFDKSATLGPDQCSLSLVVGKPCAVLGFDLFSVYRLQAQQAEINRNALKSYQTGVSSDLLESILLIELLRLMGSQKNSNEETVSETLNSVMSWFPELALSVDLRLRARTVARKLGLLELVRLKFDSYLKSGLPLASHILTKVARDTMSSLKDNPMSLGQKNLLEAEFAKAERLVADLIESQIQRGRSDREWIFSQDLLLESEATRMIELSKSRVVEKNLNEKHGVLFAAICGNQLIASRDERHFKMAQVGLAVLGLASGVGLFFDVGAVLTSALFATMSGTMIGSSAIDLFHTSNEARHTRDLFLAGASSAEELAGAESRYESSIPWAIANAIALSPFVVLAKIHSAKALATTTQDVERLAQLNRYQKLTVNFAIASGAGITAAQAPMIGDSYLRLKKKLSN